MPTEENQPGYRDEERLRELYHGEGLSQADIAKRFDCCRKTIGNWMDRFDIELNPGEKISKKQQGKNNSVYNSLELTCDNCGEEFERPVSNTEQSDRDFCGRDCYMDFRRSNPEMFSDPPDNTINSRALIQDLQRLSDKLGSPPSYQDIIEHGAYGWSTYASRFGCVPEAREAAGLQKHLPFGKRGLRVVTGERHPYGETWRQNRKKRIQHDDEQCVVCGISREEHEETYGVDLHVHHIHPAREFDDLEEADALDNLVTLCSSHHRVWENMPVVPDVK